MSWWPCNLSASELKQVFSKRQQPCKSKGKWKIVITVVVLDGYSGRGKGTS